MDECGSSEENQWVWSAPFSQPLDPTHAVEPRQLLRMAVELAIGEGG
jgi:hypothetical protein